MAETGKREMGSKLLQWDEWRGSTDMRPTFFIKKLVRAFGCVVQVHKFVGPDDPGCFHTHPAWAIRIVLRGGYVEQWGDGSLHECRPGLIGLVAPHFEHRIDRLINGHDSWSLWLRGPKVSKINVRGC